MEQLLGKHYKWWYILIYEFKRSTVYVFNDVLWLLSRVIVFLLSVFIWSMSERKDTGEIVNYLVVGNLVLSSLMPLVTWTVSQEIYNGSISSKLLVPTNITIRYFLETIPHALKNSLVILLAITPCLFLIPGNIVLNLGFAWILAFVPIAYIIKFFIDMLTACSTFWLVRTYGVNDAQVALTPFLTGSLFPLSLLPSWLIFVEWQPYAFTFYHSMQIYLGN